MAASMSSERPRPGDLEGQIEVARLGQAHDLGEVAAGIHAAVEAADDLTAPQEPVDVDGGTAAGAGDPDQRGDRRPGRAARRRRRWPPAPRCIRRRRRSVRNGVAAPVVTSPAAACRAVRADEGVGAEVTGGAGLGRVDVDGDDPGRRRPGGPSGGR